MKGGQKNPLPSFPFCLGHVLIPVLFRSDLAIINSRIPNHFSKKVMKKACLTFVNLQRFGGGNPYLEALYVWPPSSSRIGNPHFLKDTPPSVGLEFLILQMYVPISIFHSYMHGCTPILMWSPQLYKSSSDESLFQGQWRILKCADSLASYQTCQYSMYRNFVWSMNDQQKPRWLLNKPVQPQVLIETKM